MSTSCLRGEIYSQRGKTTHNNDESKLRVDTINTPPCILLNPYGKEINKCLLLQFLI